jgi:3-oxoacyl-[acyl-carrier-protein] synthase-1
MTQAIRDAGLTEEEVSNESTGIFSASAGSSSTLCKNVNRMHEMGPEKSNPKGVVASVTGTINFNLVSIFKILGSSCGFASACASSGHALGMAHDEIKSGRQDRMFVIGAEDGNGDCILPFAAMRALSLNTDPETGSRPFDKNRDGFVGTGGSVTLVLEERSVAEARGAHIYAEFKGWGMASDGYNSVLPEPVGDGLRRAIQMGLKSTGISETQVDYINAHAPSTQMGDAAEMKAIKSVFLEGKPAISSTKALTGHGLSLASAMEAGITVLAMEQGFCPGSAHIKELDPLADGLNIIRENQFNSPKIAISNSSGFGGANVSLVFQR